MVVELASQSVWLGLRPRVEMHCASIALARALVDRLRRARTNWLAVQPRLAIADIVNLGVPVSIEMQQTWVIRLLTASTTAGGLDAATGLWQLE